MTETEFAKIREVYDCSFCIHYGKCACGWDENMCEDFEMEGEEAEDDPTR